MRAPRAEPAASALALYRGAPLGHRLHVRARWLSCPLDLVAAEVPRAGKVLDVGCGHGLLSCYLALEAPTREVIGTDIDEKKLAVAERAAMCIDGDRRPPVFRVADEGTYAPDSWDAIVVNDVLYLMGAADRRELLELCAGALAPGGVLVVKEIDHRPSWKYRLTVAQEVVSTRVLRITEGDRVAIADPAEYVAQLRDLGLDVKGERIDRGYLHPHVLMSARRAA